nr:AbrB family transcriptional regulator [Stakelama sediminis]
MVVSALLAGLLEAIGLSAGMLLGPMIAAVVFALRGAGLKVPVRIFQSAQTMVGCLIAQSITAGIAATLLKDWPIFLGATAATLTASAILGYLLSRWQVLPDTTAIWGSMPGAASAMMLLADSFGADARLVAFMSYMRVVCVAAVASLLAVLLTGHGSTSMLAEMIAPVPWKTAAISLAIAAVGGIAGVAIGMPAGALTGSLTLAAILNVTGIFTVTLPGWLLALGYAVVGWRIGLTFTPEIMAIAGKAFWRVLAAVSVLLGFAFLIALALSALLHIDLLTAYLAVSPGGMDSVAIIAASVHVDRPFVMALQVLRFVAVIIAGPILARFFARRFANRD